MKPLLVFPILAGLLCAAPAGDGPLPGHSLLGQSFNDGPRREGALIPGCGAVDFPVTAATPETQQWFNQGVAQLHGFWYWEAERSFRTVLKRDPKCLMAYWGLAMANVENPARARGFLEKSTGEHARDHLTEKERAWLSAVDRYFAETKDDKARKDAARRFVKDLEDIAANDPKDIEARAFALCFLWRNSYREGIDLGSVFAADAVGRQALALNPAHPVHHYLIHLWDKDNPARALEAAAECGPAAPAIAHMWHMPGHIYSDLERWSDAAWQQEASARVDHAHMIRTRTMPDLIHNYAHNNEWLARNLNHLGRVRDALTVSENLIELPRIPRSPHGKEEPDQQYHEGGSAWKLGRDRLTETILRWELWDEALRLADTPWLAAEGEEQETVERTHLIALANFRLGHPDEGEATAAELARLSETIRKDRAAAVDKAEMEARKAGKNREEIQTATADALKPFQERLDRLYPLSSELEVLADLARGRKDEAQEKVKSLRGIHDQRLMWIYSALGETEKALEKAEALEDRSQKQTQPLALLAHAQWAAGKKEEAIATFRLLSTVGGFADLETPLLARLREIADAAGCPGDWRTPAPPATDLGERPPLDTLGPLRWAPFSAPEWTATRGDGSPFSSAELAGQPRVLLFFLGNACTHCNTQLKAFSAQTDAFFKAGIRVMAVSTDAPAEVAATENKPPFPVVSGADTTAFKAADAWDDFEEKPLHATVFIDSHNRVRWQHIGHEPFLKPEFLLEEAKRLADFDDALRPATATAAATGADER